MKTVIEMAEEAGFGGYFYEAKSMFERFAELVRAEALAEQPARPYRQLQDNGSKYFGPSWDKADQALDKPQKRPQNCGTGYCSCIECVMEPAQHEPVQETLQQQLEKAKAALYNARADTRRIQQIIMRQS